jgi:hypothetical protein
MFSLREKRVGKPWTKARRFAFDHRFPTLIHLLPTLRRGKPGSIRMDFQQQVYLIKAVGKLG